MKRFMRGNKASGVSMGRGGGSSSYANKLPAINLDDAEAVGTASSQAAATKGETAQATIGAPMAQTTSAGLPATVGTVPTHAAAVEVHTAPTTEARHGNEELPPTNQGRIELTPDGLWFNHHAVATGVAESFKAHYNEPYMNWTVVPLVVRDRWFFEFQRKFTWKTEFDEKARRDYEKKGLERLKDHMNKAAKIPPHEQVKWMSKTVRSAFVRKRQDPDFLKRSAKAKKNRYSNQTIQAFDPGHRQGSISTIEVTEKLAAKNNGVLPSAAEVYEKTHGVEMVDGENILIGRKAKETMAQYNEKIVDYKNKGVKKEPDDVYLEVVGGRKKGKVYGLGSASSVFYKAPTTSKPMESTHAPSLISQLQSQVEECKKMAALSLNLAQSIQEAYDKDRAQWLKEMEQNRARMENIQKVVYEMATMLKSNACNSAVTPNAPRAPRDPSGGGASCPA